MEKPDSTTHFVCLFRYRERIRAGLVLLAEATSACLFGTYQHPVYLKIRSKFLPPTNLLEGLNRSDPLKDHLEGRLSFGKDTTTYMRQIILVNCLRSGPQRVHQKDTIKDGRRYHSWTFSISKGSFTIPVAIARAWRLGHYSTVRVQWDALEERYPILYAPRAEDTDKGKGVGIRVLTTLGGKEKEWIQSNADNAVLVANTLYDFLHGRTISQNYSWLNSRKFIFGYGRLDKLCEKEASSDGSSSDD